jgi:hypothetical protein
LRDRVRDAVAAVEATPPDSSDLDALRAVLRDAALFGFAGAFPGNRLGSSRAVRGALLEKGRAVLTEIADRMKRSASGSGADRVRALFGPDFPWIPRCKPPDPEELEAAIDEGGALGAESRTLTGWLEQVAAVRAPAARWREVAILARASAGTRLPLEAVQLPVETGRPWVGLPFGSEENRPPSGFLSIVWHRAQRPAAHLPWVGLAVDEWAEVIPARTEQTAIAFHYDDPGAEAPQTVLLAVSPPTTANWSLDLVFASLDETLDLARLRGVDGESLGPLAQFLPGIYLAANPRKQTITTEFASVLVGPAQIVGES